MIYSLLIFITDRSSRAPGVVVPANSITFDSVSYTAAPHYETQDSGPMPEYEEITETRHTVKVKESLISAKSHVQSDSNCFFSTGQQSPENNQEYTTVSCSICIRIFLPRVAR
jgi:hypothetical protein